MFKYLMSVLAASVLFCGSVIATERPADNDWSAGPEADGAVLIDGVLRPITDQGVSLGNSTYGFSDLRVTDITTSDDITVGDDLTVTDDATIGGILNTTVEVETIISSVTTSITPTGSFVCLTSTESRAVRVQLHTSPSNPVISTTGFTSGHELTVISSATRPIEIPAGVAHYLVAPSSPIIMSQWDSMLLKLYGSYWVHISSSIND